MAWAGKVPKMPFLNWYCRATEYGGTMPAAVTVGDCVYLFGGPLDDRSKENTMQVLILDTKTYAWDVVLPSKDGCAARVSAHFFAVSNNHKVYICSEDDFIFTGFMLYIFDTHTRTWEKSQTTGDVPYGMRWVTACIVQEEIYICTEGQRCVWALDLNFMNWRCVIDDGWRGQFYPRCVTPSGRHIFALLIRVDTREPVDDAIALINPRTGAWKMMQPRGTKSFNKLHWRTFVHGEQIYATMNGIFISDDYSSRKEAEFATHNITLRYSPKRNTWDQVIFRGTESIHYFFAAAVVRSQVYFFSFGGKPRAAVLDLLPSLKVLCFFCLNANKMKLKSLPPTLRQECLTYYHEMESTWRIKGRGK